MSRSLRTSAARWRDRNLPRLTEDEKTWFVAIHSTGIDQKEAYDLARTATRRGLFLSMLTQLKADYPATELYPAIRNYIRGRPLYPRSSNCSWPQDSRGMNRSDLRRPQ